MKTKQERSGRTSLNHGIPAILSGASSSLSGGSKLARTANVGSKIIGKGKKIPLEKKQRDLRNHLQ